MPEKVLVTGLGVISALGMNASENYHALINNRHGVEAVSYLKTYLNEMLVAEVKCSNEELINSIMLKKNKYLTRTSMLGLHAAEEAFNHAALPVNHNLRIGIVSATSVGGMDKSEIFYADFLADKRKGHLRNIVSHDCGESTERIADHLGIHDYLSTISTACSSSANAIMLGARLIKNNMLDAVIAGGTDALTKFTLNGFNTLMILDRQHCRPFDDTRTGLNLGEGAGFIFMESESVARKRKATVYAEVSGYGNANDAYHQTASSPDGAGAVMAMQKAFKVAQLQPSAIDYINVHGTGTPNNDLSEGKALQQVFNDNVPSFSSTKAFTGHTLAAAGGIEAVFSVMSIINQVIFPNLNFTNQMKELHIKPETTLFRKADIRHVLSNSFGFGGNNSSLIFSKT